METVEIYMEIHHETDAAFLVSEDGENKIWLPKSQVETDQDCGPGDSVIFIIPEWLAFEKELI